MKTETTYETIIKTLDYFRLGLRCGFIPKEEIISWADFEILNGTEDVLPSILFDISLSKNKSDKEIVKSISDFIGLEISEISGRLALGEVLKLYNESKKTNLIQLKRWFDTIQSQSYLMEEEEEIIEEIVFWIGEYMINKHITENLDRLKSYIYSFLKIYEEYNIHTPNKWESLNLVTIDEVLKLGSSF